MVVDPSRYSCSGANRTDRAESGSTNGPRAAADAAGQFQSYGRSACRAGSADAARSRNYRSETQVFGETEGCAGESNAYVTPTDTSAAARNGNGGAAQARGA